MVESRDPTNVAMRRALSLSKVEGMVYAAMVGLGEAFFLADAMRLGATSFHGALVVSLPLCVGSLGSLIALGLLRKGTTRKAVVCTGVFGQVLVLAALAWISGSGGALETTASLVALACLHQVFGQAAGTAWSSWFGDLVPDDIRGRYFASRNRWVHFTTLLALSASGLLLQELEPASAIRTATAALPGGTGYRVIFGLAALFRLVSFILLARTYEPRFDGISGTAQVFRFLKTARGSTAWRLLVYGGALMFFVYWGSPYFAPFMLSELKFSYVEYTIATVCIVVAKVSILPFWGRLIDRKEPRLVYRIAVLIVAFVPLPFLMSRGLGLVIVAQALSGASWGGYEVAHFTLLLESTYRRTRPVVFAALNLINGAAQIAGTLSAAPLLGLFDGNVRWLFAASLIGRLSMAVVLPFVVLKRADRPTPRRRRQLLLRTVGMRAHGGVGQRPIYEEEGEGTLDDPEGRGSRPVGRPQQPA